MGSLFTNFCFVIIEPNVRFTLDIETGGGEGRGRGHDETKIIMEKQPAMLDDITTATAPL